MQNPIRRRHFRHLKKHYKWKTTTPLIAISIHLLLPALLFFQTHATPLNSPENAQRRHLSPATSQKSYITYDVLKRDKVPCDRPGIPYYSCGGGGSEPTANPYVRGCSIITSCREDSP